jgi:hypothetical protein
MEAQPLQRHKRRRFPVILFEVFVVLVAVKGSKKSSLASARQSSGLLTHVDFSAKRERSPRQMSPTPDNQTR